MNKLVWVLAALSLLIAGLFVFAHLPPRGLPADTHADRLVLLKSEHKLLVMQRGRTVATYRVALGQHPEGPKQADGDGRTPEGVYVIDYHVEDSPFGRALHISYPSSADWDRASRKGVDPGRRMLIHGLPKRLVLLGRLHRWLGWTDGSIGVTTREMRQLYRAVPDGTTIELRP